MPTPSTLTGIRDNVLTGLAAGYNQSYAFVAKNLFPDVQVNKREGKYLKYNKEMMMNHSAIIQKGRNAIPDALDFDLTTTSYELKDFALASQITTIELEEGDPLVDIRMRKLKLLTEGMALYREMLVATEVQDNTNYDATNFNTLDNSGAGKYKWSHASADPIANILAAMDAIKTDIGMLPNVLVLGWDSAVQLAQIDDIKKLAVRNSSDSRPISPMAAAQTLATYAGIDRVFIGMTSYTTSATGTLTNIWSDNAVLAYVGTPSAVDMQKLGVMLNRKDYPQVFRGEIPRTDGLEEIRLRDCFNIHAVNWDAAYLIEDTV